MTKEQRERLRQHFTERASFFALFANDDRDPAVRASRVAMADDYIAALSLLTDEAELQRSVGEAVIATVKYDPDGAYYTIGVIEGQAEFASKGNLSVYEQAHGIAPLLRAIARALREGGR